MRKEHIPGVTATAGRPPPSWWSRLDAAWPHVRVTHTEVRRLAHDSEPYIRIRTVVHLEALVPADVQVDISHRYAQHENPGDGACRLWSVQSYRNSAFVFEATATEQELAGIGPLDDLVVRVRPAHREAERPFTSPVMAPLPLPSTRALPKASVAQGLAAGAFVGTELQAR
jgi:hypothetical protein